MYNNIHSFTETRVQDSASLALLNAKASTLTGGAQYAIRPSLLDELRTHAAGALFSLGTWIKPRTKARVSTPVQLRQVTGSASH